MDNTHMEKIYAAILTEHIHWQQIKKNRLCFLDSEPLPVGQRFYFCPTCSQPHTNADEWLLNGLPWASVSV